MYSREEARVSVLSRESQSDGVAETSVSSYYEYNTAISSFVPNGEMLLSILSILSCQPMSLTVYCLNGANAPRYRGCLPATSYGIEAIKMTGSVGLKLNCCVYVFLCSVSIIIMEE